MNRKNVDAKAQRSESEKDLQQAADIYDRLGDEWASGLLEKGMQKYVKMLASAGDTKLAIYFNKRLDNPVSLDVPKTESSQLIKVKSSQLEAAGE